MQKVLAYTVRSLLFRTYDVQGVQELERQEGMCPITVREHFILATAHHSDLRQQNKLTLIKFPKGMKCNQENFLAEASGPLLLTTKLRIYSTTVPAGKQNSPFRISSAFVFWKFTVDGSMQIMQEDPTNADEDMLEDALKRMCFSS